jgi:predicted transcriptional regulator
LVLKQGKEMKLKEVAAILNAEVICGQHKLEREVEAVFASDLMSDVLTIDSAKLLLLTGLVNIQTIRTSEMSDIQNIVLVRNKKATPDMITMAEENGIVLIQCSYSMYKSCGLLFQNGLNPVY